jgi:hypothetical protein
VTIFLIIGAVGLAVILLSLLLGEVVDGLFDAIELDAGGIISGPAIGAFLAAFGFGGALTLRATGGGVGTGVLGGAAAGIVVGGLAGLITRSVMRMPTDRTFRSDDLVGVIGTVITRIPDDGLGEITLTHLGHLTKLNARAEQSLPAGRQVVVTAVLSSSAVQVEPWPGQET